MHVFLGNNLHEGASKMACSRALSSVWYYLWSTSMVCAYRFTCWHIYRRRDAANSQLLIYLQAPRRCQLTTADIFTGDTTLSTHNCWHIYRRHEAVNSRVRLWTGGVKFNTCPYALVYQHWCIYMAIQYVLLEMI